MSRKIFHAALLVAVAVLLSSLLTVLGLLYSHFSQVQTYQLKDELSLAVTGTEQYGNAFLENVEAERFRLTWVDANGTVLFDTKVPASSMENHGQRDEIRQAILTGTGSSSRHSDTLMEKTYYEARRLKDGTVLRISASQASAAALILDLLPHILMIAAVAICLSALLSRRMAKKIVEPLNRLDLEKPLQNDAYEELSPLLRRLNQQHNQIAAQLESLRHKADQFQQITDHMQEGLVLLDNEGTILSINPTAQALFQLPEDAQGRSFLALDRSPELRQAVNHALDQGHGTARIRRQGREWQLDLSRIESDGTVLGAAVLAFDITERLNAEQLRREFSANVSHELKTPLQSIIGSAELLEQGLVRQQDIPRFISHIRRESSRLVALIEDIIRLSSLDEGIELPKEDVELLSLARETASELEPAASAANVTVTVTGQPFPFSGVRRLLYEILYNLLDNAIRYNIPGGSVHICVTEGRVTVSDTGIGIPQEHQSRIFERFYRVDKSHSKASGGTGLGLSIVKHAVQHHGASLQLESQPGKGTRITVSF